MKLRDITPKQFQCKPAACIGGLGCPGIYETDRDSFVIIGKRAAKEVSEVILKQKIGPDEVAIEISKGLLSDLNR